MSKDALDKYIATTLKLETDRAIKEALKKVNVQPNRVTRSFNGR